MKRVVHLAKVIVLDILGVICLIGAVLLGWVPGPGGIPLAIAGLALLAINHEWARQWLEKMKTKAEKLLKRKKA